MDDKTIQITNSILKKHKSRKRWLRYAISMACVVALCTAYVLILPAIAMERPTFCGLEEHTEHTEECYAIVKTCMYGADTDEIGQCVYVCGKDVIEETAFTGVGEYAAESEPEFEIVTDSEYSEEPEYMQQHEYASEAENAEECPAGDVAVDTDEPGYPVEPAVLPKHEHTEACVHIHTEECFEKVLVCELPLHTHTLACCSNPELVENPEIWEQSVLSVEKTGVYADDLVAAAQTQLGYRESTVNFAVLEDGVTEKGYTRYGDWYGHPYGDWCAMFVSFCLYYADIDSDIFPYDCGCTTWVAKLDEIGLFRPSVYGSANCDSAEEYIPAKGDIIFFDYENSGLAGHVGIVSAVNEDENGAIKIDTIEGNYCDSVAECSYTLTDPIIYGYGQLPENPCPCKDCYDKFGTPICGEGCECLCHAETETDEVSDDKEARSVSEEINGVTVTVTGDLPEGAALTLSEISEEQLREILELVGGDTPVFAYDITITDAEGNVWQPDELGAAVSITGLNVSGKEDLQVVHVPEDGIAEAVKSETSEGKVEFPAEGFSIYVGYTVDFHYEGLTFSITGEGSILLSELFEQLNIPDSVADIVSVEFSDYELVGIERTEDGDYLLTSFAPFDTVEALTITFADGRSFTVIVTDARSESVSVKGGSEVKVHMDWVGDAPEDSVTVTLYKGNTSTGKATLNSENKWSAKFTGLAEGNYSIEYSSVDGYDLFCSHESTDISTQWKKTSSLADGKTLLVVQTSNGNKNAILHQSGSTPSQSLVTVEGDTVTSNVTEAMQWKCIGYKGKDSSGSNIDRHFLRNISTGKNLIYTNSGNFSLYEDDDVYITSYSNSALKYYNSSTYQNFTVNYISIYEKISTVTLDYTISGMKQITGGGGTGTADVVVKHSKTIDYLGDDVKNPDTELTGEDYYRLYLDISGKMDPIDLLIVLDESASMNTQDVDGMARDRAFTEFLNGGFNSSTSDGFISKFLSLNEQNMYSVIQFCGEPTYTTDNGILVDWRNSNAFARCEYKYYNGTNYMAGLNLASSQFDKVRNDGHRKVMLFLSDGVPTFYIDSDGSRKGTGIDDLNDGDNSTDNAVKARDKTLPAITKFTEKNSEVMIFPIGVGMTEEQSGVLKSLVFNGGSYIDVRENTEVITKALKKILYVNNASITDVLSKYVRYYSENPDLRVVMREDDTKEKVLFTDGAINEIGKSYISSVTYTPGDTAEKPTGSTGTVSVEFLKNYYLDPEYTFILSFNVELTQTARDEYAANSGYSGTKGDELTDYAANTTSSEQPGFYSNDVASGVTYLGNNKEYNPKYSRPVVQVHMPEMSYRLPETGGIGTDVFILSGTALCLFALLCIAYETKKHFSDTIIKE